MTEYHSPQSRSVTHNVPADQLRVVSDNTDLRVIADRIRSRVRRATIDVIATGKDLLAVKARLGHGEFLRWIAAEFKMTDRTAQRYIGAAEWAGEKSDMVSVLPPTAVYLLAAPTTPQPIKDRVLSDLGSGVVVDIKAVKQEIGDAIWREKNSPEARADASADRKLRRAKRRGKLTPQAEQRIARERDQEAEEMRRRAQERDHAVSEAVAILSKLSAPDIARLRELEASHFNAVSTALSSEKAGGVA